MSIVEKNIEQLKGQSYSCSQATLVGISRCLDSNDCKESQLYSLASGLEEGMGCTYNEGTCGAFCAGVMALGLGLSYDTSKALALSKELFDDFKREYGTVSCGNIIYRYGKSRCIQCCKFIGNKVIELLKRETKYLNNQKMAKI